MKLDDYQIEARTFLLERPRAILADEFGVGKTWPALDALFRHPQPALIVCPGYLMLQWREEIKRLYPEQSDAVTVLKGTPDQRFKSIDSASLLIAPYEALSAPTGTSGHRRNYLHALIKRKWQTIIYDEGQYLRNHHAGWSKGALKLDAPRVWLLAGSVMMTSGANWYGLLKIMDRKTFSSYWRFVESYFATIKTPWATEIGPVLNAAEFTAMLKPYVLKRTKKDVGIEIPEEEYEFVPVELPARLLQQDRQIREDYHYTTENGTFIDITTAGAAVVKRRLLTSLSDEKLKALIGIVNDHPDENIVIWCWHREVLAEIERRLSTLKRPVWIADGDGEARSKQGEEFKAATNGVLVATIAGMAYGANFQHATVCIFMEQTWVPETNKQAVGRLVRRGQDSVVRVYLVQALKTIDTSIYRKSIARSRQNAATLLHELLTEAD